MREQLPPECVAAVDLGSNSFHMKVAHVVDGQLLESLYMGCVGLSSRFFHDGRIRRKSFRSAQLAAEQELEPIREQYREVGWEAAIGASGTIRTAETSRRQEASFGNSLATRVRRRISSFNRST